MTAFLEGLSRERVFVVARGAEGEEFLDLATVSFTVEGAANLADSRDLGASLAWKKRNQASFVLAFDLVPVSPVRELEIPTTPARRFRGSAR